MSKHSKLPWRIREIGTTCFIEADKNKETDPYNIEVMGDDTNDDLYPESQKRADAELIVQAVNGLNSYRTALKKKIEGSLLQDYLKKELYHLIDQTTIEK